jgi:hypothetical protein
MKIKFTRTFSVEIDPEVLRNWFDYAKDESPLADTDEQIAELLSTIPDWEIIDAIGSTDINALWQTKVERI